MCDHKWRYNKVKWWEPQDTEKKNEHTSRMRECDECDLREYEFESGNWYFYDKEQDKWLLGGCQHEFNEVKDMSITLKYSDSDMLEDAPIESLDVGTVTKKVPTRFCHKCGRREIMVNIKEQRWAWLEGTGDGAEENIQC